MKLHTNLVNSILLVILFALSHLQCGNARTLATSTQLSHHEVTKSNNSSDQQQQQQQNETTTTVDSAVTTLAAQTKSLEITSQPTSSGNNGLTHIVRKKRETEVVMPFDFNTMHLPCDLDQNGRGPIIETFPNHCVWVWNNRYVHEGFFRVYKTYQLEAFFFGQYYERLKRFEIDPHTWDYSNSGI
ncbi:hypothetical protein ACLKA6_003789 [Drosophila palustris]